MISMMFLIVGVLLLFISSGIVNKAKKDVNIKGKDADEYFKLINSGAVIVRVSGILLILVGIVYYVISGVLLS